MNNLDKQYTDLLQDILDNGIQKGDRTGTGTISVFGRQIRHKMSEGFPLLTTKKMHWKSVVTELLWFLRGDTNIKFLVDNGCNVWNGDAYKNFEKQCITGTGKKMTQEEFINFIKTDDGFAKKWGELGPIYGKQWRSWYGGIGLDDEYNIDQIQNLINDLKTNPDSRRLMVNAWNVGELDQMILPPCHYGFQVYTRELSKSERYVHLRTSKYSGKWDGNGNEMEYYDSIGVPKRAISLMWNQRSVDTPLGLPFNIASYGLLLEIIAKIVNMVPDELIGNLGDTHIYLNQIDGVKEQIGRELTARERTALGNNGSTRLYDSIKEGNYITIDADVEMHKVCDEAGIPIRTREPFPLPKLNINTEFWQTESNEIGEGPLCVDSFIKGLQYGNFIKCLMEDIQLSNYQYHPAIKMPLSN